MIKVFIQTETLTDGSEVFNVRIGNVVLHATERRAAYLLAEQLAHTINEFTVDDASVADEHWYA